MADTRVETGTETNVGAALKRAIKIGLIGGVVGVYCGATGIIERFDSRTIINELLSMGDFIPLIVALGVGYLAATPKAEPGQAPPRTTPALSALYGGAAGASAGAVMAVFLLLIDRFDVRAMFENIRPPLINTLSYFGSPESGAAVLIIGGVVVAVAAALVHLAPPETRRGLVTAFFVMTLLSLVEPLLRAVLNNMKVPTRWLYQAGGLARVGAVVVFVGAFAISYAWRARGGEVKSRVRELPAAQKKGLQLGGMAVLLVFLILLPNILTSFLAEVVGTIGLYIILGLGLNIVVGYAGLLDLGYVAFLAVGSYSTAILVSPRSAAGLELTYLLAVPIVIVIATIVGIMIGAPVLRLRGDYLAIVTLGFGEIARIIFLSDWAAPWFGGAQGILGVSAPEIFGINFRNPQRLYYLILVSVLIVAFISARLAKSRVGRAWNAMREDEQVAEAMGISIIGYKLLAFATGAALGCVSGMFFAIKLGSVFPHSFNILVSINVLALIILGGMGSIPGVIVGAFVLVGLPELLREFAEYRLLFYGAILVALMLTKPEGLLPSRRRQRELHLEEDPDLQYEKQVGEGGAEPIISTGGEG